MTYASKKYTKQISSNYVSRKGTLFFSSHVQKFHTLIEYTNPLPIYLEGVHVYGAVIRFLTIFRLSYLTWKSRIIQFA